MNQYEVYCPVEGHWVTLDDPEFPDHYVEMLAEMAAIDIEVLDEDTDVIDLLIQSKYDRINADSFRNGTRRSASKTRAFYKRQARRNERRAGTLNLRNGLR